MQVVELEWRGLKGLAGLPQRMNILLEKHTGVTSNQYFPVLALRRACFELEFASSSTPF